MMLVVNSDISIDDLRQDPDTPVIIRCVFVVRSGKLCPPGQVIVTDHRPVCIDPFICQPAFPYAGIVSDGRRSIRCYNVQVFMGHPTPTLRFEINRVMVFVQFHKDMLEPDTIPVPCIPVIDCTGIVIIRSSVDLIVHGTAAGCPQGKVQVAVLYRLAPECSRSTRCMHINHILVINRMHAVEILHVYIVGIHG